MIQLQLTPTAAANCGTFFLWRLKNAPLLMARLDIEGSMNDGRSNLLLTKVTLITRTLFKRYFWQQI